MAFCWSNAQQIIRTARRNNSLLKNEGSNLVDDLANRDSNLRMAYLVDIYLPTQCAEHIFARILHEH